MIDIDVLERALDRFHEASGDDVPAVVLHVSSPGSDFAWTGVRGRRSRDGEPARADDCFRVASVAKTLTAATTLALVEDGLLHLDDTIEAVSAPRMLDLIGAIPAAQRAGITVERLLQHTSGVYDFGTDAEYLATVGSDPGRRWTDIDLVALAMRRGPLAAFPGERFVYSDTGYTLLASALEHVAGRALPVLYRDVLSAAGVDLPATWLEGREPAPPEAPVRLHQYLGGTDTYDLDPSCDTWGGGGLVSTAVDLARFIQALVAGRIVRSPALLTRMLACTVPTDLGELGAHAGFGIFRTPVTVGGEADGAVSPLGVERLGHEGFWGVWMHHVPQLDLTISGAHTGVPVDQSLRRELFAAPIQAWR